MQTSVIGFPRIGTLRELKFASEKYFRGEISSQELLDTAKNLRKIHWTTQKNEGIDFIPSTVVYAAEQTYLALVLRK